MTATFRCADDAEERAEGLAGTASRADRFVLVEFPTPWPHKALDAFSEDLRAALAAACESTSAKLLLVRRPGERTPVDRRWAVYDVKQRKSLWGDWATEADLGPLVVAAESAPTATWSAEPAVLVCTHARHDACCGVRGRQVAAALAEVYPDLVWECTHVGGHRFAANLVLPLDGTYYGRIEAEGAAAVIEAHLDRSEVSAEHLRGFSWMAPAAQAVAVEAHRRWGPAGTADIEAVSVTALGSDRWRVELTGGQILPTSITAEVERIAGPEARLSCRADPSPTESFVIRTLS
ncbi:MAG TPA: sucrase/ferredoxin-like family protein [Aeromicrobium sp.]|nr:sucrase/ferredoxin-like family protein [Aeromicrobium sp.]HKY59195.1 sucrase/ferredoxin-like family protein [Aeromicrobium sp.]